MQTMFNKTFANYLQTLQYFSMITAKMAFQDLITVVTPSGII